MMKNCKLCGNEFYADGYRRKLFCCKQHSSRWGRLYNKLYTGKTVGVPDKIIQEFYNRVERPYRKDIKVMGTSYLKELRLKRARLYLHFGKNWQRQRIDELLEVYDLQEIKEIVSAYQY